MAWQKTVRTPEGIDRRAFLNCVSAAYTAYIGNQGRVPSIQEIKEYAPHTLKTVTEICSTPEFSDAAKLRGIPWDPDTSGITPEQQLIISLVTNPTDRRPLGKKLQSAGISYHTYRAWLKQPLFAKFINNVAEDMLQEHISDAHVQLVGRVQGGDLNAIKFLYELTGRHDPAGQENVNLRAILGQVLEIIQRRVTDADVLNAIASDFAMLGGVNQAINNPAPVGAITEAGEPIGHFNI